MVNLTSRQFWQILPKTVNLNFSNTIKIFIQLDRRQQFRLVIQACSKKLRITTVCLKKFNSVLSVNWRIYRVAADFCYQNGQLLSEISQKSEKTKLLKRTQYLAIALVPVISTQVWWTFCIWFGKCIFFHPLSQAKSFDV